MSPSSSPDAVLITGASTGIGRMCALDLAGRGYHVFAGVRREQDGESLRREAGTDALRWLQLDVTDPQQIRAAATVIDDATGSRGLRAVVNNAGIGVGGPLEYIALDDLREQFEVNVVGQIAVTQAVMEPIRRARGRIVMMSSISGRVAAPFLGAYAASKFALEALSDALRMELRDSGVKVVIIEPGTFDSSIWERSMRRAKRMMEAYPPEAEQRYGHLRAFVDEAGENTGAAPSPRPVAAAVRRAIEARRPRLRYLVGKDAKIGAWLRRRMTDRMWDRFVVASINREVRKGQQAAPGSVD